MAFRQVPNPQDPDYTPSDPSPVTGPSTPIVPTPPPTATDTAPGGTDFFPNGVFNGDYQGYFRSLFPGQSTLTGAQLQAKKAELAKAGINVVTSASGNTGWINYPGSGGDVDVIGDYGGANSLQWLPPGSGGGQGGAADLSGAGIDPSYLSPYTKSFADFYGSGNGQGALGAGTGSGSLNPPEFQDPGAFQAPTADSITSDPSYQFRLDQGRGQIENSAAGKGLLNSGGTLYDILNYGQKAASQEYGNIYQRDLGLWDQNYQHAVTDYGLKAGVNDTAYNRAWTQYMNNRDTFYKNQQNPFDKIKDIASIGATTAGIA